MIFVEAQVEFFQNVNHPAFQLYVCSFPMDSFHVRLHEGVGDVDGCVILVLHGVDQTRDQEGLGGDSG